MRDCAVDFDAHDVRRAADDVALSATRAGYRLDFRARSLWEVERLLDERGEDLEVALHVPQGRPHAAFALGCYVGEVARRARGGRWIVDQDADGLILTLDSGAGLTWPVERVNRRLSNGPEDSIVAYALACDLEIGAPPRPADVRARAWRAATHDPAPSATRRFLRWRERRRTSSD
jgi:hypothetical protein